MPHSLRARLNNLRYKKIISDKDYNRLCKALDNENVLDKIRAEIEELIEWHDCPIEYDNGNDAWYREACNQALKIIDKYKVESEQAGNPDRLEGENNV